MKMSNIKRKKFFQRIFLLYLPVLIVIVFVLLPFVYALSLSFKTQRDVMLGDVSFIPLHFTLGNYVNTWVSNKFGTYFLNSLVLSAVSVVVILVLTLANGYVLSRYKFKGKGVFTLLLLATQMMPVCLIITPLFLIFKNMHLINSLASVAICFIVLQAPFNTILMRSFMNNINKGIDEAAMVDGAGKFTIIFKIVTPIVLPGIVATSAFAFVGCWNEFLIPFSFLQDATKFTLPVGLKYMIGEYTVDYPSLAAGSVIALIPPILLFAFIQKYLISGLSGGAVKG